MDISEFKIFGVAQFKNSGQYLGQMANRFDTSESLIQQANAIENPNKVKSGSTYLIPKEMEDAQDYLDFLDDVFSNEVDDDKVSYYISGQHEVQRGESVEKICSKYGITKKQFYELNPNFDKNNPDFIKAGDSYNIVAPVSDSYVEQKFNITTTKNRSTQTLSNVSSLTLKTADELAYPEGTNDFDRASELLEIAEAGVPDEIKQQAQEFFNSQKYRDAIDKNKFGIYDKLYNRTLLQYGNTDPNYNPNYDLGDVFCVTKVEKGDEVGWTSYLTGFPESEIIANNQLNAAGKLAIGNTYIYECADNSYFEKYETYRDNGEDYYVIDNYQVPQGEKVNIDELLEARGVDREVFNLFNPAYAKSEEAYADQILTLPLEHPDFKPDTFVDAWGNEFQVEKPSYVKEKDRRTYEAMMAPIMASYGGNMPASILTEREYSNAVYNFNNPAEVQQLIADNPELFYDFREANLYILLYHGDNKTLYTPSMTYKEDLYGGAKYTYHANGADVTYDKSTLYSLIGIDSAQLSWSSPTEPPYSDTTFYRDEKDKSKRYSNTIYSNTTIEFDYKTLKDINRFD